jgi:hypothetical protein
MELLMDFKSKKVSLDKINTGSHPSVLDVPFLDPKGVLEKAHKLCFKFLWVGT